MNSRPQFPQHAHPSAATETSVGSDAGPYARPSLLAVPGALDAVLIDAIRATVGPYVPAEMRSEGERHPSASVVLEAAAGTRARALESNAAATLDEHASDLPWIDAFVEPLDGAMEPPAAASERDAAADASADAVTAAGAHAETADPNALFADKREAAETDDANGAADADPWALDATSQELRAIAAQFAVPDFPVAEHATDVTPSAAAPLPMWSDDDAMDIMPVASSARPTENDEHWAARARRGPEHAPGAEAAAGMVESVARRIRDGELSIPGYSTEMGEAATLAAVLAAMLGARP
jgi:hypothetical protein